MVDVDDTYYDNSTYGRIQYDRVAKGRALLLSTGISSTGNLYFGLNYSQSILFQIRDPDEHSGDDGIDDTSMGDLSISIGYRFFDLTNLWEIKK